MQNLLNKIRSGDYVLMGILNVTPDSFSDGGQFNQLDAAVQQALTMQADGAGIIDIGGESTRPGAKVVPVEEEIKRVVPVIKAIRRQSAIPISIDTSKPEVMRAAIEAGASMINDVNALQAEGALEVCADLAVPVCLMHKQGEPQTMQDNPVYSNVLDEVQAFLQRQAQHCLDAGIAEANIIIDPGFGFGKRLEDNLQLLSHIDGFVATQHPVLVGVSRKSMFGVLLGLDVDERKGVSVAAAILAYARGARFFRVHDVKATCDALKLCLAVDLAR